MYVGASVGRSAAGDVCRPVRVFVCRPVRVCVCPCPVSARPMCVRWVSSPCVCVCVLVRAQASVCPVWLSVCLSPFPGPHGPLHLPSRWVRARMGAQGLDYACADGHLQGDVSRPRRFELAAAINRFRGLRTSHFPTP